MRKCVLGEDRDEVANAGASSPPSALPGISPTGGEIGWRRQPRPEAVLSPQARRSTVIERAPLANLPPCGGFESGGRRPEIDEIDFSERRPKRDAARRQTRQGRGGYATTALPSNPTKISPTILFISLISIPILRSAGKSIHSGTASLRGPILTNASAPFEGGAGNGETL